MVKDQSWWILAPVLKSLYDPVQQIVIIIVNCTILIIRAIKYIKSMKWLYLNRFHVPIVNQSSKCWTSSVTVLPTESLCLFTWRLNHNTCASASVSSSSFIANHLVFFLFRFSFCCCKTCPLSHLLPSKLKQPPPCLTDVMVQENCMFCKPWIFSLTTPCGPAWKQLIFFCHTD